MDEHERFRLKIMNKYDSYFSKICRVCLTQGKSENMISLIDKTSADGLNNHGKAVTTFADVFISSKDDLPSVICQNCVVLLKQAIYFKKKCELSDKQLKRMKILSESSQENFKESVCQFAIFRSYFPENFKINKYVRKKNICVNAIKPKHNSTKENIEENNADIDSDGLYHIFDDEFTQNEALEQPLTAPDQNYTDTDDKLLDIIETAINCDIKISQQKYYEYKQNNKQENKVSQDAVTSNKKHRNFACHICQKVLANSITYDHHMQRHNGCRFICDQCGKGFATSGELNMHQVVRHGHGQFYQCNHCPYKAPRKLDLVEHLRLHTGERPYTCEKCGLTFRRKAIWRKHLILHTDKNIQCSQCPRKFFTQSALSDHMNNIHERRYVYVCSKCGVTYAKNKTVRDHLRLKHGIPREMQGKIDRVCKSFPT